jgi:hypothetical protein
LQQEIWVKSEIWDLLDDSFSFQEFKCKIEAQFSDIFFCCYSCAPSQATKKYCVCVCVCVFVFGVFVLLVMFCCCGVKFQQDDVSFPFFYICNTYKTGNMKTRL